MVSKTVRFGVQKGEGFRTFAFFFYATSGRNRAALLRAHEDEVRVLVRYYFT